MTNSIAGLFLTPDRLLAASDTELQHALLRHVFDVTQNPMQPMVTRGGTINELFRLGGGGYDYAKKAPVEKAIIRAWKALEDADLLEEPDPDNGKNGYRVVSQKGRAAAKAVDFGAAKIRSQVTPDLFHSFLRGVVWRAFCSDDYDTAVIEAFRAVEIAVRKKSRFPETDHGVELMRKAFNPTSGPLKAAEPGRAEARRNFFTGAFGELRNPKAHQGPTITDPLVAIEEMMTASLLLRIVDHA